MTDTAKVGNPPGIDRKKLTIQEALEVRRALEVLKRLEVPAGKTSINISLNFNKLNHLVNTVNEFIEKQREKYLKKGNDGKYIFLKGGTFEFKTPEDMQRSFAEEKTFFESEYDDTFSLLRLNARVLEKTPKITPDLLGAVYPITEEEFSLP